MAMDFQKYLDDAFSKINIADFLEPGTRGASSGYLPRDSRTHYL